MRYPSKSKGTATSGIRNYLWSLISFLSASISYMFLFSISS